MSRIVDFYLGEIEDTESRNIEDIWAWSHSAHGNDVLESAHDYIQWIFPLREQSNFNADAPLITDEDVAAWQADPVLRGRLVRSTSMFLKFLGLELFGPQMRDWPKDMDWQVARTEAFEKRENLWKTPNHNWLRISRMLGSLMLLGMPNLAKAIYKELSQLRQEGYGSENSFSYWRKAVGEI